MGGSGRAQQQGPGYGREHGGSRAAAGPPEQPLARHGTHTERERSASCAASWARRAAAGRRRLRSQHLPLECLLHGQVLRCARLRKLRHYRRVDGGLGSQVGGRSAHRPHARQARLVCGEGAEHGHGVEGGSRRRRQGAVAAAAAGSGRLRKERCGHQACAHCWTWVPCSRRPSSSLSSGGWAPAYTPCAVRRRCWQLGDHCVRA